jgi:hypothetical protein
MAPKCEGRQRHGGPVLVATSEVGRTVRGSSVSAVRTERTAHQVPSGRVSADQRGFVVRGRVEPPTFRFSGTVTSQVTTAP